jgi:UDP-N-acetyl-2-amino-2-deoxyglucuronate dehydrogenase
MWRDEAYYRRAAWRGRWEYRGWRRADEPGASQYRFLALVHGASRRDLRLLDNVNHPFVEIEDDAVAVIRFHSGALGMLKGTVSMNPERRIHGVSLVGGSGATASLDCWQVAEVEQRVATGPWDVGSNDIWTNPESSGLRPISHGEAVQYRSGGLPNFHAHQFRDAIGAIRECRPPAVTGIDGRRVAAMIQGVYESGRTGRPVKLSD